MENVSMNVTVETLSRAFKEWNVRSLLAPEEFWAKIDESDDCATAQAKYLMYLLGDLK
jgi:hypothetical protein